ncbi:hypothetical protein PF005_g19989 [Phytophthora fragariae]|uniref:Isopropylmalate dehydrogenase-like domain-containing protein n=1 Tax=Phytophthora fragariae TaxID=53985 RepID=A0A6A3WTC0_9STRA|nr:hypothetical protein PF011_g22219 [Phytophthora fragariae]KAE9078947.1 hypothetical protein PF010_g22945 [Phytophthora fragariae]KAE9131745.1 hypothetical protein PF007_g3987 [Phytophthora fragariae]KAE9188605.1 hypothetical protein PF005_g19989 [Phytophthora fragariae]KAE9251046.1 hypothetical protein PF002_g4496 [Phytophthora fragariae]
MPPDLSLLKPSIITNGVDMVIVREIVSGIYFSEHTTNGDTATDVMKYTEAELAKPTKFATNDVDYTIDFRRVHVSCLFCFKWLNLRIEK